MPFQSLVFLCAVYLYSVFLYTESACGGATTAIAMETGVSSGFEPAMIDGPERVTPGSLVVLTLRGAPTADWAVIPAVPFHVDRDGKTLVFASSRGQTYYAIAAVIVPTKSDAPPLPAEASPPTPAPRPPGPSPDFSSDPGRPRIFVHRCIYVDDDPLPSPNPDPTPGTLRLWVSQNLPAECATEAEAMAAVYKSVAAAVEDGAIRTRDAAFAAIRSGTQRAASVAAWQPFLADLSSRLYARRGTDDSVAVLATHLRTIADGFHDRSEKVNIHRSIHTIPYNNYGGCPTGFCPPSPP